MNTLGSQTEQEQEEEDIFCLVLSHGLVQVQGGHLFEFLRENFGCVKEEFSL